MSLQNNNYGDDLIGAKETIISKSFIDRSINKRDNKETGSYQWAEHKTSLLCNALNHDDVTNAMLLRFVQRMAIGICSKLGIDIDYALELYVYNLKNDQQKDDTRQYPVGQSQAWIDDPAGLQHNFYALINFIKWVWIYTNRGLSEYPCDDGLLIGNLLINNFQQNIFTVQGLIKDPRENKNYDIKTDYIGISDIEDDNLKRTIRNNKKAEPWNHPGKQQCFVPYFGNYGLLIENMRKSGFNKYSSLKCGISGSVNYFVMLYLISGVAFQEQNPGAKLILTLIMILAGDGGHNIREIMSGLTMNIIVLQTLLDDIRNELQIHEGISIYDTLSLYEPSDYNTIVNSDKYEITKSIITASYNSAFGFGEYCEMEDKESKATMLMMETMKEFSNFENVVKELYKITSGMNVPGLSEERISKINNVDYARCKQSMYDVFFNRKGRSMDDFSKKEDNIELVNDIQLFFSMENNRHEKILLDSFVKFPDKLITVMLDNIYDPKTGINTGPDMLKQIDMLLKDKMKDFGIDIDDIPFA